MKFLFSILGLTLLPLSASAKTYFDEANQRAVVYYKQGANVNASLCDEVSEQELRRSLQNTLSTKCKPLSDNGLSKQDIEPKLPQLKQQMLQALGAMGSMMNGLGGMTGDKQAQDMMNNMFSGLLGSQKQTIENLTADQVFQQYDLDARTPTLEKVKKSDDLDTEIEQFVLLTSK